MLSTYLEYIPRILHAVCALLCFVVVWFRSVLLIFQDYFTGPMGYGSHVIDLIHKSQNALVPYPTILHSEQKCAHFCSEWSIVGYETGAFWDLWYWSIDPCANKQGLTLSTVHFPGTGEALKNMLTGKSVYYATCPVGQAEIWRHRYSYRGLGKQTLVMDRWILSPTCLVRQVA